MNRRLQKKCVVAATGFHLLLLAVLLFGAAFFTGDDAQRDLQMVEIFDINKLIDAPFVGGGTPEAKPPPPAPPVPPKPVEPPTTKPEAAPKTEDSEPEVKEVKQPKNESLEVTPKKPHKPAINLTVKKAQPGKKNSSQAQKSNSSADTQARENAQAFSSTIRSLRDNLSPGTTVGIPGAGGEAYAGYENVLQSIYQRQYDVELSNAPDVADSRTEVEVSVTIARDGTVRASRLTKPSGNAALNKLVQRVLNKVTFIAPFPARSKDQERTFNIIFDLKPKKALG